MRKEKMMSRSKEIEGNLRTISASKGLLTYELQRKAVKNVNLRINKEGKVKLSAAPTVPVSFIDEFVRKKESFILSAIQQIERGRQEKERQAKQSWKSGSRVRVLGQDFTLLIRENVREGILMESPNIYLMVKPGTSDKHKEAIWQAWQKRMAKEVLEERMQLIEEKTAPYGITCREMSIRRMTSRWGSCQPQKGKITLNSRLMEAPLEAVDYVVLHELTHMKYPHHQKSFYEFIARFMPDWKTRKAMLKGII